MKGAGFFIHTDDISKYLKKVGKGTKQKEVCQGLLAQLSPN